GDKSTTISVRDLRQPVWSPDGQSIAAAVNTVDGPELWVVSADGGRSRARRTPIQINSPAWTPTGDVACIAPNNGHPRITIPCGGEQLRTNQQLDIYGPLAFSRDGTRVFTSAANERGTVDLWSLPTNTSSWKLTGRAQRLSSFSRDSYAPSLAVDG